MRHPSHERVEIPSVSLWLLVDHEHDSNYGFFLSDLFVFTRRFDEVVRRELERFALQRMPGASELGLSVLLR